MEAVNDKLVAWLRTVVPVLWSAVVAWAVTRIPALSGVQGWLDGLGAPIAMLVVTAVVYPVLRWLEARLPDGISRLLTGSAKQPTYVAPTAGAHTSADL